jgi:hypothetical protein
MEFVSNPRYRAQTQRGERVAYIPARSIAVPVNKENILKNRKVEEDTLPGWVSSSRIDADKLLDTMVINISKDDIRKPDLMILDLLAHNNWERPVYFVSMSGDMSLDLRKYYQYLGFTYKLVPLREAPGKQNVAINTDELYDKMMNVYRWGNMNKKGIFVDYNNSYTLTLALNVRGMHARLAEDLMNKGRKEEAVAILDSAMVRMPACNFPLNISAGQNDVEIMNIIQLYYRLNQTGKADAMAEEFVALTEKNLAFFSTLRDASYDLELNLAYMQQLGTVLAPYNEELSMRVKQQLDFYLAKLGYAK